MIEATKETEGDDANDSFWNEECAQNEFETTAHPFSNDLNDRRQQFEIEMLPKRIAELRRELQKTKKKLKNAKDTSGQISDYWRNKTKEIETKNVDLCQRMEVSKFVSVLLFFYFFFCCFCAVEFGENDGRSVES